MFEEKVLKMNKRISECLVSSTYEKRTYTVEEIQSILDIGRNAAYGLVKSKAFRSVRVGGSIRISKASFEAWLDGTWVQADE